MRKIVSVSNIPDFKDGNGFWVKCFSPKPYVVHTTRSQVLWNNVVARCKVGGCYQRSSPTYIECINGFKDFQEFAGWCQYQYGYMNKEKNGRYWQLDKDLKVFGNRVYSKENCILVPQRVNMLLVSSKTARGDFPLGVCWHLGNQKFITKCHKGGGIRHHLGYFDDPVEAHQAWQKYKVELIRKVCTEDEEIRNHLELVPILLAQAQRIEDDLLNDRETT